MARPMSLEAEAERSGMGPASKPAPLRFSPRVEFLFRSVAFLILWAAVTVSLWVLVVLIHPVVTAAILALIVLGLVALGSRLRILRTRVDALERQVLDLSAAAPAPPPPPGPAPGSEG